jgi:hypothetical protein
MPALLPNCKAGLKPVVGLKDVLLLNCIRELAKAACKAAVVICGSISPERNGLVLLPLLLLLLLPACWVGGQLAEELIARGCICCCVFLVAFAPTLENGDVGHAWVGVCGVPAPRGVGVSPSTDEGPTPKGSSPASLEPPSRTKEGNRGMLRPPPPPKLPAVSMGEFPCVEETEKSEASPKSSLPLLLLGSSSSPRQFSKAESNSEWSARLKRSSSSKFSSLMVSVVALLRVVADALSSSSSSPLVDAFDSRLLQSDCDCDRDCDEKGECRDEWREGAARVRLALHNRIR